MKRSPLYTLLFATGLGVACAALLTVARQLTAERRTRNAEVERVGKILDALGIEPPAGASAEAVLEIFGAEVRAEARGGLEYYTHVGPDGRAKAVAVHFQGQGLWGPIRGFLGLDPDMQAIRRLTFYEQHETPGLGGKIEEPEFLRQFERVPVRGADGRVGLDFPNITSATMTSARVREMLNETLRQVVEQGGGHDR